ncbi:peptidoglycan-binding protein [Clostridium bowmanii]|uniref:GH25 family lysozyme n=1 Tax=Clostridium bowmanii TaxID=132925 RepID=UPI001C0C2F00|nr:GH25 family lysozyme [Clostridium bowmanii]MBU3188265.1 peptidoglycan-binding protein [Clostridium bowmanii]MCA1072651.1 peptidoglycan-binding protein [Clostridium bowmanii]
MRGIDIASYQQNIDFEKVKKSGIEIVYIKATQGITYKNPLLESQYSGAMAAGLKIGFYHYLKANDPTLEAKHFLSVIAGLLSDCKLVIDVEEALGQTIAKTSSNVRIFANYLIANGKEPCIYTGDYFYSNNLDNSVKDIPLWVAHYGVSKPDAANYIGFQYSESGKGDGINGLVDLDEFSSGIFISSIQPIPVNAIVKAFQHVVNLVGLVDKNKDKLIEDGIEGAHTNEVIAKILVIKGANNELVMWVQQRLIALGFNCGKTGADSYFGSNTLIAVKNFQISRGLKSDGIVGPLTITQLLK